LSTSPQSPSSIVRQGRAGSFFRRTLLAVTILAPLATCTLAGVTTSSAGAQPSCTDTSVHPDTEFTWSTDTGNLYCNLADLNGQLNWGVQDLHAQDEGLGTQTDEEVDSLSGQWPGNVDISLDSDTTANIDAINSVLQNEYAEGGVGEINWNPNDPITEEGADSDSDENTNTDVCSYILPGDSHYGDADPFNGSFPAPSDYFQGELQSLYTDLTSLYIPDTTSALPTLLRLLPEMNGFWFWWGTADASGDPGNCTSSEYQELYQYVIGWLTDSDTSSPSDPVEPSQSAVENVISVWAPAVYTCDTWSDFESNCAPDYPTNPYVDVVGMDAFDNSATLNMPQSTTVMGGLDATVEFGAKKYKMPAMTSGENSSANSISNYWKNYFCGFAYDTTCYKESSGDSYLTAMRFATVWYGSDAPTSSGDFVSALGDTYTGLSIVMASQQGAGNPDPWDCANMSC
jgi:Glycosyl hydrolase family 26